MADESLYEKEEFKILDSAIGGIAIWKDVEEAKKEIIYPVGIEKYL